VNSDVSNIYTSSGVAVGNQESIVDNQCKAAKPMLNGNTKNLGDLLKNMRDDRDSCVD
jgi:hypothetical protein